ncbi:hypothetical protein KH172YL63_32680 [Bacillus sp. KH172YL63]|nr:hypothetical protein KH172YL63_32680 [Bacillus sp. KH172YL63]
MIFKGWWCIDDLVEIYCDASIGIGFYVSRKDYAKEIFRD